MILPLFLFLSNLSFAQFVGFHCHLKMIKKGVNNNQTTSMGVGIQGTPLFNVHESKGGEEEVSMIVVSRGSSASLQVQTTQTLSAGSVQGNIVVQPQVRTLTSNVFVTCKGGNSSMQDIKISLNSPTSSLSTEVSVGKGSRVSLGSIVTDLNNKTKELSIDKGIAVTDTEGTKQFEYWLEVD